MKTQTLGVALALVCVGCATVAAEGVMPREAMRQAIASGHSASALAVVDAELKALPKDDPDRALWLLERATLALQLGQAKEAASAFAKADPMLEVLSLDPDDAGRWAAQLFSASAAHYKAPAYEKLMVNVLGMLARLGSGDMAGARIEARRLQAMDDYFSHSFGKSESDATSRTANADPGGVLRAGRWLAGLVFELSKQPRIAERWYLAAADGHARSPASAVGNEGERGERHSIETDVRGQLVVIGLGGRVPQRVASPASPRAVARAAGLNSASASGLSEKVALLGLAADSPLERLSVAVGESPPQPMKLRGDIADSARASFRQLAPQIAKETLSRARLRAAAKSAAPQKKAVPKKGDAAALASWAGAIAAEYAVDQLAAADVPDTRGWASLPATLQTQRRTLAPGKYVVTVSSGKRLETYDCEILAGQTVVIIALFN